MKKEEIYDLALKQNGLPMQMMVCMEEFAELQKELAKAYRGYKHLNAIAEEIADCEIMLEQMKRFFNCEKGVKIWKDTKLQRLERRLKGEEDERI